MKRTAVIYIAGINFGAIDAYLPLFLHLAALGRERIILDTLVPSDEIHETIASSPFHLAAFEKYGGLRRLSLRGRWPNRVNTLYRLGFYLGLLVWRRLTCRHVVVLGQLIPTGRSSRILLAFANIFGRFYYFPGIQTPYTETFGKRMTDEGWQRLVDAGIKRSSPEVRTPPRAICYTAKEFDFIKRSRFYKNSELVPIGIPRLYPTWRKTLAETAEPFLERELERLGLAKDTPRIVTIILTNPSYYWFPEPGSYERMFSVAIARIRDAFPDAPILLKAKPQMLSSFAVIKEQYCTKDPTIGLTSCGLSVLALRSVLALTINESSGVFDFIVAGVPVIEYGAYSSISADDGFGPASAWRDFPGLAYVEDESALQNAINTVRMGTFPVATRAALERYFGHREDLTIFNHLPGAAADAGTAAPATRPGA